MKKVFTLLCMMLFAAQIATAQKTLFVISKSGELAAYSTNKVTFEGNPLNKYVIINGHKFVDLGLPSGLLWAETNIGAEVAADGGNYFAWGETEMATKPSYYWDTYKYGTSSSNITKYNSTDKKTTLDKEDDAAYVNWGSSCRMPTYNEFLELHSSNCTWTWASQVTSSGSTINGYKVTSKKNGNSIFLPASGRYFKGDLLNFGTNGYYWTSTLQSADGDLDYVHTLFYESGNVYQAGCGRTGGIPIRPVAEP